MWKFAKPLAGAAVLLACFNGGFSMRIPDLSDNQPLDRRGGVQGPKLVFAHYMVGNTNVEHVHQDVDDAVAMGLDGFALNVGDPTQPFVRQTFNYMFDYARDTHPNFKLFLSMDLWASGASKKGLSPIDDYHSLLADFMGHNAWLRYGPNNLPFLSTFSDGGYHNDTWMNFRQEWGNSIYLVPNFDGTQGYYENHPAWWEYWGNVVDGLFSWESAWPIRPDATPPVGGNFPGDVSLDKTVIQGTTAHGKTYMIPLSPLQYKCSYDTNIYRGGDFNLPSRITNILGMSPSPDFVQIISWNDGLESHYIGNLWPEQNHDPQPELYASQAYAPHNAWRPLISSFVRAFKGGLTSNDMWPNEGVAEGALWYKTIMNESICKAPSTNLYTVKPNNFETSANALSWAVIVAGGAPSMEIHLISNGEVIHSESLSPGLNYGTTGGIRPGYQRMELWEIGGNKVMTAAGGRCISSECPECIYNMNPQVVPLLSQDVGDAKTCANDNCGKIVTKETEKERLDRLDYVYPGIFWEIAYPGGGGNCTMDQFNVLEEATRMALEMLPFFGLVYDALETPSFNRYFVRSGSASYHHGWKEGYHDDLTNLINNMQQVELFPLQGEKDPSGHAKPGRRNRITYSCLPPEESGLRACQKAGVQAYTTQDPIRSQFGTHITFCQDFFNRRYINDITAGRKLTPRDLGGRGLDTYERTIIHEWMHCDIMGFQTHIGDSLGNIPGQPDGQQIYGSSRCHEWAWSGMTGKRSGSVNPKTAYNADNYAWYYVNRWYEKFWSWEWDDDGFTSTSADAPEYSYDRFLDIHLTPSPKAPLNCAGDNINVNITCSYLGKPYDEWLLSNGHICQCTGSSCSVDSPSCCASKTCPPCSCNKDGCTPDSPTCCISGCGY